MRPSLKLLITLFLSLLLLILPSLQIATHAEADKIELDPQVLGASSTNLTETQKTLLLAKPAVIQVINIVSGEIIIQATVAQELQAPSLSGQTYNFEIGASGSGFFVTSQGHLITNGHVAKPEEEMVAYYAIQQLCKTIFIDAVKAYSETHYSYTPTDEELETAFQSQLQEQYGGSIENLANQFFEGYRAGELKLANVKYNNYIQTGLSVGSEKVVKEKGKSANLIDTLYTGDFNSKDLALLKVEGNNFPTIDLGSSTNVNLGTEVYAIGYPGVVEELMGVLTDEEAGLEPSMTKGIVSAKKKLVDGTEAFQTDAAITHGNSGGPAIGTDGKLIGVTTWGFGDVAGGDGFNFLISVEKVKDLLAKNNVTASRGIVDTAWEKGISLYSENHYSAALKEFETAKRLYPDNVDVDKYIQEAQSAISRGEDIPLLFGFNRNYVLLALGGILGVVIILFVIVVLVVKRSKKTTPTQPIPEQPSVGKK